MNINSIQGYDGFLVKLNYKIKANPDHKNSIIREAIKGTGCPYLENKLKDLDIGNSKH